MKRLIKKQTHDLIQNICNALSVVAIIVLFFLPFPRLSIPIFILAILSSVSLRLFFTTKEPINDLLDRVESEKEPIKEDEFDYSEAFKNIIIFLLILYASGVFDKISEKISRKEKNLEYCLKNPDSSKECKKIIENFNEFKNIMESLGIDRENNERENRK